MREFASARAFLEKALEISLTSHDASTESKCYVGLGRLCNDTHDFVQAKALFRKAIPIKTTIGDVPGLLKAQTGLGLALHWSGEFSSAITRFETVLGLTSTQDFSGRAGTLINKSMSLLNLGRLREALDFQTEAETLAQAGNDLSTLASAYSNLGIIYGTMGEYQRAIEFCERALRTGGSELEKASFHQNIGNGYFNLGQFSLAIESFKRAFVVKNRHNEWRGIALCNMNLGNSYGSMGDFARALEFHTEALAAAKAHADPVVEAQCHLNLGSTYVQTGDDASKCTAPGSLDTHLCYAAWRSSYSSRASIGV